MQFPVGIPLPVAFGPEVAESLERKKVHLEGLIPQSSDKLVDPQVSPGTHFKEIVRVEE